MSSRLLSEHVDGALVLTMSDPASRNALSPPLVTAAIEAFETAESDDEVHCIVLRGDGGHFCAGGNLKGLAARRQEGPPAQVQAIQRLHRWIESIGTCPKPVIAAIEGWAAGAGFSIALACDLVVAARGARFALSHAKLGITPDGGATWQLARMLPRQAAQQLVWLGDAVGAEQLLAWGVVTEVCDDGTALDRALALAQRLAAMAPNAVAAGKQLVADAAGRPLREQLDAERDQFVRALFHANGGEGLQAALEKRPPRFQ